MAAPSRQNGNAVRNNPNGALPGEPDHLNVKELSSMITEAQEQAKGLAAKANRIYRKLHPDDKIRTDIFDMKNFLEGNTVVIPPSAQELFDEAERQMSRRDDPQAPQKGQDDEPEPSVDDLRQQFDPNFRKNAEAKKEKFNPDNVKRHPVLDKLRHAFGVREKSAATVEREIEGIKFTFEYPTSLTTSFATAIASGEGVGQMDFAYNYELSQLAMSVVAIDGEPVCSVLDVSSEYGADNMPAKVRKFCGVKMYQVLQQMGDASLSRIMQTWQSEVKPVAADVDKGKVVELSCPKCGHTRMVVGDKDGMVPVKYCEDCGTKMEQSASAATDADAPLA